jgi:hypothetical protein
MEKRPFEIENDLNNRPKKTIVIDLTDGELKTREELASEQKRGFLIFFFFFFLLFPRFATVRCGWRRG